MNSPNQIWNIYNYLSMYTSKNIPMFRIPTFTFNGSCKGWKKTSRKLFSCRLSKLSGSYIQGLGSVVFYPVDPDPSQINHSNVNVNNAFDNMNLELKVHFGQEENTFFVICRVRIPGYIPIYNLYRRKLYPYTFPISENNHPFFSL